KLRALAIASARPSPIAPDLPTVAEAAGIPGFSAEPWNGVLAPAGLPADVTQRLNAAINRAMSAPQAREVLRKLGQFPLTGSPRDFADHIRSQTERWAEVIETSHIPKAD
ncbi:ABC transporter substrate-binding protein, partial [Achromobacter sp. DMS1]|uniref:tripartite tricarboxylate transporter substrate-binding protein n=1 Tax=Achromobacter sp. DMS1 TaxID=1688405 RepID=UPI0006BEE57C